MSGGCSLGAAGLDRLGHRRGALRHHGDATGDGFRQGGVGRHGGHLLLPQVKVTAGKRVEIRWRV